MGRAALMRSLPALRATLGYLALSLVVWWHLVAHGLRGWIPSGSADTGPEVWYFGWIPHALAAGTNPLLSRMVAVPHEVNLMANTSTPLLALLFAPVTALVGPLSSFDLACLIAPVASALGAWALCRRFVTWEPAAFVGGLVYGFGPFLAFDLRFGHLQLTFGVLVPLILVALVDAVVPGPRRPVAAGTILGLGLFGELLVSTEQLALTVIMGTVALAVVAGARPAQARAAAPRALRSLGVAAGLTLVLSAYPVWLAIAGPGHFSGAVWPTISQLHTSLSSALVPGAVSRGVAFISGGNGAYLGVGLVLVLVVGVVLWWEDLRLRLAAGLGALAYLGSCGYSLWLSPHIGLGIPLPVALLGHLPLVSSLIPSRFGIQVDVFAGLALALVLGHLHEEGWAAVGRGRLGSRIPVPVPGRPDVTGLGARPWIPAGVAVVLTLVPLVLDAPWPYPTRPIPAPAVFQGPLPIAGRDGAGAPVVLVYPGSPDASADEMVWQAEDHFRYALVNANIIVPGRGGRATTTPGGGAVGLILAGAVMGRLHAPLPASATSAVRHDLASEGVDLVVVLPDSLGAGVVRQVFSDVLGPPNAWDGGAALWVRPSGGR